MKRHLHILYIFFVVGTMSSQEKQIELSMNEAIDYALKNSYDNRIANKNIDAAKQKKWETTTIGLPQIDAKVDYQNWLKQQVSLLPAKLFDPTAPDDAFAPVTFGTKQNLNATITLKQLLFDGSYLVGLQSAKTYLQISKQAKQKNRIRHKRSCN
jgi:outer membrane protein TolC